MLCTRIRLCERRYNYSISARETPEGGIISATTTTTTPSTSLSPSSLSTLPGSSLSSSARIIQRPCIIRNLTNNCGNNSSTISTVVGGEGTDAGTVVDGGGGGAISGSSVFNSSMTPRQIIEQSIAKKTIRKKPQLVVFTLSMPSDTKTALLQNNVKRDPRKLPIFCENYKQITKHSRNSNKILNKLEQQDNNENFKINDNNNNNNGLFIRGFEIFTEQQKQKENSENLENCDVNGGGSSGDGNSTTTQNNSVYVPSELKIQLNDCCECIRDIYEKRKQENLRMFFNNNDDDENAVEYEHNTECTKNFLTVNKELANEKELLKKTGIWIKENILRNPSPRTRQVINITMNNKKKNLNDK